MEPKVYSVSRVNAYIRGMFEDDSLLGHLWVTGEVSNVKYHSASRHIYFSIKDERSQLRCIMFESRRSGLDFKLEEGQSIKVYGSINVFERDGTYQMYAERIKLSGRGELYEKFLMLKGELYEEGLFSPIYKQKLPFLVKRLGIVTAKGGAALQDIINISTRRNPYIQLILYPAKVQGEGAAGTIVKGIKRLSKENVDAIIVGRGGGSIEDLWAFNEEIVARAIFDSPVPIISAVGHATDTSISDYVADVCAPTPSAAAELAVANISDVQSDISKYELELRNKMEQKIELKKAQLSMYQLRLNKKSPKSQLKLRKSELDALEKRMADIMKHSLDIRQHELINIEDSLNSSMKRILEKKKYELNIYIQKMKALSPLEKLSKGYAYIEDEKGRGIASVKSLSEGSRVTMNFSDGKAVAEVRETSTA